MSPAAVRVAIVGAGLAGANGAPVMTDASLEVQAFDKSRGAPGFRAQPHDAVRAPDQAQRSGRGHAAATGGSAAAVASSLNSSTTR